MVILGGSRGDFRGDPPRIGPFFPVFDATLGTGFPGSPRKVPPPVFGVTPYGDTVKIEKKKKKIEKKKNNAIFGHLSKTFFRKKTRKKNAFLDFCAISHFWPFFFPLFFHFSRVLCHFCEWRRFSGFKKLKHEKSRKIDPFFL